LVLRLPLFVCLGLAGNFFSSVWRMRGDKIPIGLIRVLIGDRRVRTATQPERKVRESPCSKGWDGGTSHGASFLEKRRSPSEPKLGLLSSSLKVPYFTDPIITSSAQSKYATGVCPCACNMQLPAPGITWAITSSSPCFH
jgi:hypothetical protein